MTDPVMSLTHGPRQRPRLRHGWAAAVAIVLVIVAILAVATPFATAWHVNSMANVHDSRPSDAIVVLGAAQYQGTPSPVFANRLEHAATLYQEGISDHIITVGGKQPGDQFTEAESGQMFLEERGVPQTSITAVSEGSDTITSLEAVAETMAQEGWRSATIVSDPAHEARAHAIAQTVGMISHPNSTISGDGSHVTAEYLSRETGAFLWYIGIQQWSVPRILPQGTSA